MGGVSSSRIRIRIRMRIRIFFPISYCLVPSIMGRPYNEHSVKQGTNLIRRE